VNIALYGNRENEDVIKLRILKWGGYFGLSGGGFQMQLQMAL
jgi:hypothetical protein